MKGFDSSLPVWKSRVNTELPDEIIPKIEDVVRSSSARLNNIYAAEAFSKPESPAASGQDTTKSTGYRTSSSRYQYSADYTTYQSPTSSPSIVKTQRVQVVSVGLSFSIGLLILAVMGMIIEKRRQRKAFSDHLLEHQHLAKDTEQARGELPASRLSRDNSKDKFVEEWLRSGTLAYPPRTAKRLSLNSYAEIARNSIKSETKSLLSRRSHNSHRDSYASSFGNINEEEICAFNETGGILKQRLLRSSISSVSVTFFVVKTHFVV